MNPSFRPAQAKTGPFAAAIFFLIYALLLPVTVIGYILWAGKALLAGRGSGVSSTAQGPLSARYFEHILGLRQDEASARLLLALPNVPALGMRLFTGPLLLAHRASGYVPKAFRYPYEGEVSMQSEASARQTFFDSVVERCLLGISQLVILGAGFDTRSYRLPQGSPVHSFEIDTPKTQAIKRALLEQAGIDVRRVGFVSADFERDDWFALLVSAGFDPSQPGLFLWEGVTMYLDREAVESALRKIAGAAPGSKVAFDYATSEMLTSQTLYLRFARAMTTAGGEPLKFGIDSTPPSRRRLEEFLQACGLALVEQRTLGDETNARRAFGGFAIAAVDSSTSAASHP